MSANCLNTLGNGGYQLIKFALSRPTSGFNLKISSHLLEARKLSIFSTDLPGLWTWLMASSQSWPTACMSLIRGKWIFNDNIKESNSKALMKNDMQKWSNRWTSAFIEIILDTGGSWCEGYFQYTFMRKWGVCQGICVVRLKYQGH